MDKTFGTFNFVYGNGDPLHLTLAHLAHVELNTIEALLASALRRTSLLPEPCLIATRSPPRQVVALPIPRRITALPPPRPINGPPRGSSLLWSGQSRPDSPYSDASSTYDSSSDVKYEGREKSEGKYK